MAEVQCEVIAGEEVMSASQIAKYLNKSRAYIYAVVKRDETFPSGFSFSGRGKRLWKKVDVDQWLRMKMDGK